MPIPEKLVQSQSLTVMEAILVAAVEREETNGNQPLTAEDIVVTAYQTWPKQFGLKGYADQYPAENKIISALSGGRGVVEGKGWLSKVGQKLYTTSRIGRQAYAALAGGGESAAPESVTKKLNRSQEKFLEAALTHPAFEKWRQKLFNDIVFPEACSFFGVTQRDNGVTVGRKLAEHQDTIRGLKASLNGHSVELPNGREVSVHEADHVGEAASYLQERFGRHLKLLIHRNDRE